MLQSVKYNRMHMDVSVWRESVCIVIISLLYYVTHVPYMSVGVVHKNMPNDGLWMQQIQVCAQVNNVV